MFENSRGFHRLIAQIYETAATPEKWPELLDALTEFVERDHELLHPQTVQTSIEGTSTHNNHSPVLSDLSLTQALRLSASFSNTSIKSDSLDLKTDIAQINTILLQHFRNALDIAQRLADHEENNEVIISVLNRLPIALIIVDPTGKIIEYNPQAKKIIEQNDGIHSANGYLTTSCLETQEKLRNAISGLAKKAYSTDDNLALLLPISAANDNSVMAFLSPVKGTRNTNGQSNVSIFLAWPKSQPYFVPEAIKELYALTPVETEITSLLVRGFSIQEIANERDVSEHTIRSQVKSILHKTHTSRQAELIKLVLTGPSTLFDTATGNKNELTFHSKQCDTSQLKLDDGRSIAYREYGDPNGIPLFYFHSVLGSRLEFANLGNQIGEQNGFRVICPERPGYGLSDPFPDLNFSHWASDIEQLANKLELNKFCVAGYAMGAIFACAIAYYLPQRVDRLLSISSGLAARSREDFAKMNTLYRISNKMARDFPQVYRVITSLICKSTLRNPEQFFERLVAALPAKEAQLFQSERFRRKMFTDLSESWQQGTYQLAREMQLLTQPWEFPVEEIHTPADIWHGKDDHHVSCIVGEKMAQVMPNATITILPDCGHYMVYHEAENIFRSFRQNLP